MAALAEKAGNRREFFRSAGRSLLLGVLALGALTLRSRSRKVQTCLNRSVCSTCTVFRDCGLPAALSAKAAQTTRVL